MEYRDYYQTLLSPSAIIGLNLNTLLIWLHCDALQGIQLYFNKFTKTILIEILDL